MNRKKLMMILATTTIIVTMIVPMLLSQVSLAAEVAYDPDYMTVDGVLATDTYVLFPYDKKNLKIGFSKYGEMIDRDTQVGIEYGGATGTDPFATDPALVVEYEWVEGWIMEITYESGGEYKNVWALALHSDYYNSTSIDGDWQEGVTVLPTDISVLGGRKTSGGAATDDIKVLYDGPRRFVALLYTVVYEDVGHQYPLVGLTITVVFNKVKKQVILYKDLKRLDTRKSVGDMQIEFSERGQWDLGAGAPPKSYAHIYEDLPTVYNEHYQGWYSNSPNMNATYDMLQIVDDDLAYVAYAAWWPKPITSYVEAIHLINREIILNTMSTYEETWNGDGSTDTFTINDHTPVPEPTDNTTGRWLETPMVFVNNLYQIEGTDFTYNNVTNVITFVPAAVPPVGVDNVKAVYKFDAGKNDMGVEPGVPFANAEWCFIADEATDMFRAVTVYGVTDRNDGDDAQRGTNVIDAEVDYYIQETFNPYDLRDAVHKDTRRWVQIEDLVASKSIFTLANAPLNPNLPSWWDYCTFAERVLVDGVLQVPTRAAGLDYTLSVSSTTGVGTITFATPLPAGTHVKILYSTRPRWSTSGIINFTPVVRTNPSITTPPTSNRTTITGSAVLAANPLGLVFGFDFSVDINVTMTTSSTNNFTESITDINLDDQTYDLKVLYDPNSVSESTLDHDNYYQELISRTGENISVTLIPTNNFNWNITATTENTVLDSSDFDLYLDVATVYSNVTDWFNATITPRIEYSYTTHQEGQYEWMIVGKDSRAIDSAGAAYMTQAFDSKKQIHVRMTGMDIREATWGPNAPYVMAGATTGLRDDYYYTDGSGRSGLHDDWCTTNPVSSSNMLFSGGPRANLGSEYFNDFTMGFYAMGEYVTTDIGHANTLLALSCWDKHYFGSGNAVISVYKDLNGTIGFLIWGVDGQDTYYATKWFWDEGIYYLQQENEGVTDIILQITYPPSDPIHPIIGIVERLGTISHKEQHDCPVIPLIP